MRSSRAKIESALAEAIRLHKEAFAAGSRGGLEKARLAYERVLAGAPREPDALHYLGVLWHHLGRREEATRFIRRAIAARPDHPDMYNNLGNVLKEQGLWSEASVAYQKAIELRPGHADAHSNLGAVLKAEGRLDEAIAAYEAAIAIAPSHAGAHHNLGNALFRRRRLPEAIDHYRSAIAINGALEGARRSLAFALHEAGQTEQAIEVLVEWTKLDPENPIAAHMLAALSQVDTPGRASDAFVRLSFDAMAPNFDEHLRDLGYRAPELLGAAIEALAPEPGGDWNVLDAGCGTGLCAARLKLYSRYLQGIDLSEGMLKRAERLGLYDELIAAELTEFLERNPVRYDLIASADTLCYFGDLGPFFRAASGALRPGGYLIFTVERSPEQDAGFVLHAHGRYSHAEDYVRRGLAEAGMVLASMESESLRYERGAPVPGMVVAARLGGA